MAETYNLDDVRTAFRSLENRLGFPVIISEMDDEHDSFIVINFDEVDYLHYYNGDTEVFYEIAQYLIDLKKAIEAVGARVTFNVTTGEYDEEVG
jgi:hypothetical protein